MKIFQVWLVCATFALIADSPFPDRPRTYSPPNHIPDSSFFSSIDIHRLQKKCHRETPKWMLARIQKELGPFTQKKISLEAIDITHEQALKTLHIGTRYRFIQGQIYRKGPDPFGMDPFFRTIGRYADYPSIPDLPNIDFIWNHDDVTPHDFQTRDFWITSDFEDQAPIFTYAVKKDCPYLVSVPDRFTMYNWPSLSLSILQDNLSFPWKKMQKKAFWRGQSNDYARLGIGLVDYATMFAKYSVMARYQICLLSSLYPKDIDAGFNGPGFCHNEILEQIIKPLNKDGTSSAEHMRFAYLPVIDGYTATYPGYLWRLLSNSVAFKQESEDSQWFYDALEPYVHYVPIKNRMEDLIEKINWARTNDRKCHKIAQKATKFILENLMMEDVYLYCFRVFQTYEQCLDFNTQDLLEITESDSSWVRIR